MAFDVVTPTPTPTRRRLGPVLVAVILAAIVAAVSVGAYIWTHDRTPTDTTLGTAAPGVTVRGMLRIAGEYHGRYVIGQPCLTTQAGYSDIAMGAQVTVTDPAGAVVGLGKLKDGIVVEDPILSPGNGGGTCAFFFEVPSVTAGLGRYGVEVAHRGVVRFDEVDLLQLVELKLG